MIGRRKCCVRVIVVDANCHSLIRERVSRAVEIPGYGPDLHTL
jgi:hypothetical protein